MDVDVLTGPSVRLIVFHDAGAWHVRADARETNGCGFTGSTGDPRGYPSRADAIDRAVAAVRIWMFGRLSPQQEAWLAKLSAPRQPDLFA